MSRLSLIFMLLFCSCASQNYSVTCGFSPGVSRTIKISIVHIVNDYYRNTVTICGIANDSSDGTPILSLNAWVLKSDQGTVTDSCGRFCLDRIRVSDSLSFSSVGFYRKVLSSSKILDAINTHSGKVVAF